MPDQRLPGLILAGRLRRDAIDSHPMIPPLERDIGLRRRSEASRSLTLAGLVRDLNARRQSMGRQKPVADRLSDEISAGKKGCEPPSIRVVGTRQNCGGWRNARQPYASGFGFLIQSHPSELVDQMLQLIDFHLPGWELSSIFQIGQVHRALLRSHDLCRCDQMPCSFCAALNLCLTDRAHKRDAAGKCIQFMVVPL